MTTQDFYNKWNGKFAEFDGQFPFQCKDLFSFYNRDVVGNPNYVPGDAWKLYDACPAEFYTKVTNPQKGDVAVWEKAFGGFGHVAIVWDGGKFFSQNYPLKTPCLLQSIPTNQITGYLRPKNMYDNKIIRAQGTGEYAYFLQGKRRVITDERAGLAALTAIQRNSEIVDVPQITYDSLPKGSNF